jgi:hypothetical protein
VGDRRRRLTGGERDAVAQGGGLAGVVTKLSWGARIDLRASPEHRARRNELDQSIKDGSPTKTTTRGSKRRTAAAADLRRSRTGAARIGDANQRHPRLALDLAKLLRCSSTVERR